MSDLPLYPLRFEPVLQYRPWGGRRLAGLLRAPLPGDGPIGEAWLLSDRDDYPSIVADGPLEGRTIAQLIHEAPAQMMGTLAGRYSRFPLLLKFLDARDTLSVQVHPSDGDTTYLPPGERGKTEAWVVLDAKPEDRIYAGLKPGATADGLRHAIARGRLPEQLASFTPKAGDAVLLEAGTVHALGGVVVFEVQENSDVTFRLYDWDRVDPKTGHRRELQLEPAIACTDFSRGAVLPVTPVVEATQPVLRERLLACEFFGVRRHTGSAPFTVGASGVPTVLVCLAGSAQVQHAGTGYAFATGDVLLLPAALGACPCTPGGAVTLLEVSIPE